MAFFRFRVFVVAFASGVEPRLPRSPDVSSEDRIAIEPYGITALPCDPLLLLRTVGVSAGLFVHD